MIRRVDPRMALWRWLRAAASRLDPNAPKRLKSEADKAIKRLPASYQAAAAGLTDWNTVRSPAFWAKEAAWRPFDAEHAKRPQDAVRGELAAFYQKFQAALQRRGYPFYAYQANRSAAEQNELQAKGMSRARAYASPHQWRSAFDLIHYSRGWNLSRAEWAVIGRIGKEVARKMDLKIQWGGDFQSIYDPAHWELADWKSYATKESREKLADH